MNFLENTSDLYLLSFYKPVAIYFERYFEQSSSYLFLNGEFSNPNAKSLHGFAPKLNRIWVK